MTASACHYLPQHTLSTYDLQASICSIVAMYFSCLCNYCYLLKQTLWRCYVSNTAKPWVY